jgi:hypothetical protein
MVVGAFWLIAHIRDLLPKEPTNVPAYLMILVLTFGGLAAGVLGHVGLRVNLQALSSVRGAEETVDKDRVFVFPVDEYLTPETQYSVFDDGMNKAVFITSLVMLSAWGAAISASVLLKKSIVPTLAAGVIAFLSVAVQSNNSLMALEKDSHERAWQRVNYAFVAKLVPDGSVLISREDSFLHHIQFERDLICFNGHTFDKNYVNGRPSRPIDGPELMDPIRGKQLQDALKDFDQKALTEQARQMVRDAAANNRRVFVIDNLRRDARGRTIRDDKTDPTPEFIRRHIVRPKDESITAGQVAWWNVPKIHDPRPTRHRGKRDGKPSYRVVAYQLWEITAAS